jgi:hypothetical protein
MRRIEDKEQALRILQKPFDDNEDLLALVDALLLCEVQ